MDEISLTVSNFDAVVKLIPLIPLPFLKEFRAVKIQISSADHLLKLSNR
jgi:hypothetical protein